MRYRIKENIRFNNMEHNNVLKRWPHTRVNTNLINSDMEELVIEYKN